MKIDPTNPKLIQMREFLELAEKDRRIEENIEKTFKNPEDQPIAVEHIVKFVSYFSLFNDVPFLKKAVVDCAINTLDICSNLDELLDSLLKTFLFGALEVVMDYSKMKGDRDKVIKTLSTSLEILAPSALIINLGMLAKPAYLDEDYLANKVQESQVDIDEIANSDIATEIKAEVADWIDLQDLNLDYQNELHERIEQKVEELANEKGMAKDTPEYNEIIVEAKEMVNMRLTAISLILDFGDEDLSPQPLAL